MDMPCGRVRRIRDHAILGLTLVAVAACGSSAPSAASTPTPAVTVAPPASPSAVVVASPSRSSSATPSPSVALQPLALPRSTPAPFGPAGDGAIVYVDHGNVAWLDATTGKRGVLAAGVGDETSVLPSRDGTKLALVGASASGRRQLSVLGIDGQGSRTIPGRWSAEAEFDWSPTGAEIGIASDDTGLGRLTVAPVDGSNLRLYDLPMDARHLWYLPDGSLLYKGTRETSDGQRFALYTVGAPGSSPQRITKETSGLTDIIDARPDADGSRLVYHRWREPDEKGRIRLIDVATGADRALAVDYPKEEFADEIASFSPDGRRVLFVRFLGDGNQLVLAPASGGRAVPIGRVTPGNDAPEAAFSPDGRFVLARYHDGKVWLLDATGGGEDRRLDIATVSLPGWLRVAAP